MARKKLEIYTKGVRRVSSKVDSAEKPSVD
jgi:hypothetical protein